MRHPGRRLFLLAVLGAALAGCKEKPPAVLEGSGVPGKAERDVAPFTRLSVGSRIAIQVTFGKQSRLELEGDKNLLPHLMSRIENGVLTINSDIKVKERMTLRARITVPSLEWVSAFKGGHIDIQGLDAQTFEARVTDGSKVIAAGAARTLVLQGADAGQLDLRKVPAASATVRGEGFATMDLGYLEKLDVTLSGFSRVFYDGTPEIKKDIKGRARLVRRDQ